MIYYRYRTLFTVTINEILQANTYENQVQAVLTLVLAIKLNYIHPYLLHLLL